MKLAVAGILLLALASVVGVALADNARAQETPSSADGQIAGFVYHDLNGNGIRDAGEPGVPNRTVHLEQRSVPSLYTASGPDGAYHIEGVTPGEYLVVAEIDGHSPICSDGPFSFNPFPTSGCFGPTLPWHGTTPTSVPYTAEAGATSEVNFGARPADVAVVMGIALLEDDFAPPGTLIEALANGQQCGTTTQPSWEGHYIGDRMFELHILGTDERSGCASRGRDVEFIVGGVRAAESLSWAPFTEVITFSQFRIVTLTAIERHAWYWMEAVREDSLMDGALVRAMVGGAVCGETTLQTNEGLGFYADPPTAGFSKLLVPSEDIQPGCGRPGAVVSFTIDGTPVGSTTWQPGLQELQLDLSKAGIKLPPTGSGGVTAQSGLSLYLAVLAATGLACVGPFIWLARPRSIARRSREPD